MAAQNLWNEIFGCVNYLKLKYDTVLSMPVHIRKYWINRNNADAEQYELNSNKSKNESMVNGDGINSYAKLEQTRNKNNGF